MLSNSQGLSASVEKLLRSEMFGMRTANTNKGGYNLAYAQDLGGREGLIRGNRLGTLRILR